MSQILIENLNRKSAPTIRPTTDNRYPGTGPARRTNPLRALKISRLHTSIAETAAILAQACRSHLLRRWDLRRAETDARILTDRAPRDLIAPARRRA